MFSLYVRKRDTNEAWSKVSHTAAWYATAHNARKGVKMYTALYPHLEYKFERDD